MSQPTTAQYRRLERVEAVLAWCQHMLDDHPLLVWFLGCYVILSLLAIAALASAVANGT